MANEKRLIDANALADNVDTSKHDNPHTNGRVRINHINEHDHFLRMIYDAPTVDAEEVVRCENCRYFGTSQCAMDTYAFDVTEESFCSYGERKGK